MHFIGWRFGLQDIGRSITKKGENYVPLFLTVIESCLNIVLPGGKKETETEREREGERVKSGERRALSVGSPLTAPRSLAFGNFQYPIIVFSLHL